MFNAKDVLRRCWSEKCLYYDFDTRRTDFSSHVNRNGAAAPVHAIAFGRGGDDIASAVIASPPH